MLLSAWASYGSLERIDGSDDEPISPSGGKGFGVAPAKTRKRAEGDFRGLLTASHARLVLIGREGDARMMVFCRRRYRKA